MKKILIPILIFLCTLPALSQTGTGWIPYRTKANFRDSTYFYKDANFYGTLRAREGYVRIGAVTVTANGTELNILDGALVSTSELNRLVGVTSNVQTQLNAKLNTANPQATGVLRIGTDTASTRAYVRTTAASTASNVAHDSLTIGAINLADVAPLWDDTVGTHKKLMTYDKTISLLAGSYSGGGSATSKLIFTVGVTSGAPVNGDTSFTLAALAGKHIEIVNNGATLTPNSGTVNTKNGFVLYNNSTGEIRVKPAFNTNDVVQVYASDLTAWNTLTFSAAASSLLTNLVAGWQLDEAAGVTANDVLGVIPGVSTSVTVNQAGQFGRAYQFTGAGNVNMGSGSALRVQTHTISFWVRSSQTSNAGLVTNRIWRDGAWYGYGVIINATGKADYTLCFTDGTSITLESTTSINDNNWHNIIATWNGTTASLYIDNSLEDSEGSTAKTIRYHNLCAFHLGDNNDGDWPLTGYIDAPFVWSKVVSSGERATLQTSTYPW